MAIHLTNKQIGKLLDEFINAIDDEQLENFVRAPIDDVAQIGHTVNFGSKDFHLIFTGRSKDEATAQWFMVELRANQSSANSALQHLARNIAKYDANQRRFALIMFTGNVMKWISSQHVKAALKKCPVGGDTGVINKVHVVYNEPAIRWIPVQGHQDMRFPMLKDGWVPSQMYKYLRVPFDGFSVDGTELSRQEKKKAGSSK